MDEAAGTVCADCAVLAEDQDMLLLAFKLKFLLSFLAFFGIYWALFGWKFAAGFLACLFIHEMGHFVALKRRGLKAELPVFVPMMGAYVRWYSQGVSLEDLATISLAGPLYGLFAALACYGLFVATHAPIFMVLVYVGAWINFLNLLPLLGLDGAQAAFALSRLQRVLIAATCMVLFALSITNGDLFGASTLWIFLIVGLGMAWRCAGAGAGEAEHKDVPVLPGAGADPGRDCVSDAVCGDGCAGGTLSDIIDWKVISDWRCFYAGSDGEKFIG